MLRLCADAVTLGSSGDGRDQYFVMTADIFRENVQTESNRMGIDEVRRRVRVSLTTSSEGSFSFSDNIAECDGNARALRSGVMVAVRDARLPLTSCHHLDAAGRRMVLRA